MIPTEETVVTPANPKLKNRIGESLSGASIIWESLVREGVEVCFGYPGGAIMPAYDAMIEYPIHHVLTRHEQGASHMADGYARASGQVGVCIATSGPGATNLVTGIATAMLDSIPIVCITGQVPSHVIGSDAFQETDITGCTIPVTKHNYLVTKPEQIAPTIREAFYIARSGRPGPVLVDITKDAQQQSCVFEWSDDEIVLPGYRPDYAPLAEQLEEAVELIQNAKRPILFAGHGVMMSQGTGALLDFINKTNIPVACTLLGLGGFPASHPRNLGMMGMHGEIWVNKAIQDSDLIIAVGMRFDDRVTGNPKTYAPNAKKIHIELDPAEINKNVHVDVPIVGDARAVLQELLPHVDKCDREEWLTCIDEIKGDSSVHDIKNLPDMGKLFAAHVIHDLYRHTEGKALIVTDVGQHQMWEAQYYKHDYPMKLITSGGLGTMGFALPAGIGAKFAKPEDSVWDHLRGRWLSNDPGGAVHLRSGGDQGEHRGHQQWFPRDGPPVAGILLRGALRGDSVAQPRLREDRRGSWTDWNPRREALRGRSCRPESRRDRGHGLDRLPGRTGRLRVSDGSGRSGPARHD